MFGEGPVQALGAVTYFQQFRLVAIRTPARQFPACVAMVADQPVFIFVPGHLHAATIAFSVPSATVAEDDRRITPAIQKQQHLVIVFQGDGDLVKQGLRYGAVDGFIPEVEKTNFRRFGAGCP